jgi:hypothetical protein
LLGFERSHPRFVVALLSLTLALLRILRHFFVLGTALRLFGENCSRIVNCGGGGSDTRNGGA